ncbi:hypothetical protein K0M31_016090 [Melipona bicolor]|uniref:Uncharacterized protein n=1 Tax=Melipona bicolor TaxID=60889 RepID=A0AA40G6Q1_9HYME|nr:hypothetical protein K0M31_016090 [Melipona bicolor]
MLLFWSAKFFQLTASKDAYSRKNEPERGNSRRRELPRMNITSGILQHVRTRMSGTTRSETYVLNTGAEINLIKQSLVDPNPLQEEKYEFQTCTAKHTTTHIANLTLTGQNCKFHIIPDSFPLKDSA